MNELALFAGAGGGILGGHLLGWRTVCAVERDAYAAQVLAQRQNDGALPAFPIWSDVCSFDGKPWRGLVDVVSGGFPCQDISAAGKGAGIDGERSGLWGEMARIICEVQPAHVFVENSPMLTSRGLGRVLGDLAEMGFDAQWGCISAADLGARHERKRIWIVANAISEQSYGRRPWPQKSGLPKPSNGSEALADTHCSWQLQPDRDQQEQRRRLGDSGQKLAYSGGQHEQGQQPSQPKEKERSGSQQRQAGSCGDGFGRWPAEPDVGRVANGVAARVDKLKALGNGQVPRVAAAAFALLSKE
ncbi:DNA cytosine methyltransferase [Vreelandella nanhaiensis]|uniref:DNA (cytosine-5-)-methyltransferase n=1 Tax=Vreelandella nanhaiensis TaxID=1258546 RepID=A0A433KG30_9GAMM|nr:DNA cytosine methyltransferase [Halomonas nanhaiensis]RUR27725.1 DNA cytosine methyltransferase [Halomonas nanhaiensis]